MNTKNDSYLSLCALLCGLAISSGCESMREESPAPQGPSDEIQVSLNEDSNEASSEIKVAAPKGEEVSEPAAPVSTVPAMVIGGVFSGVPAMSFESEAESEGNSAENSESETLMGGLNQWELSIWKSPQFRERFQKSYLSETDIEPQVSPEEFEILDEVRELVASENLAGATDLLKAKIDSAKSSPALMFNLGNLYFQRDMMEESAAAYEVAVQKHPKYRRGWLNLSQVYYLQGNFQNAIRAYAELINTGGADHFSYGVLGDCHLKLGNPIAAESAFRMAMMMDSENTLDWKLGLARCFFEQENYPQAVSLFGNLVKEDPNNPKYWMFQGEAYARMSEVDRAAQNFEMVDRLGGANGSLLVSLGDINSTNELFDVASNYYLRALELDGKKKADRILTATKFMVGNGAFNDALTLITGMDDLAAKGDLDEDTMKDLLKVKAKIAVATGDGAEEVKVLEELIKLDPLDGDAMILLGQRAARNKEYETAQSYFERAANLEDEGFEAKAKLRHAEMLVRQLKYVEAIPLLKRAQEIEFRESVKDFLDRIEKAARDQGIGSTPGKT